MNETSSVRAFDKSMLRKLILIGMICGVVCSFSKLGWEVPFPPRTPARDETNPPQQLLQQVGFSQRNNTCPVHLQREQGTHRTDDHALWVQFHIRDAICLGC